jgi:hypothetical protein
MAKKKPARKPINASTKKTLQNKAKNSKYTYGQLAQVYRRGQGVSQLPWLLGLWGELIVLLGVVILKIMT